LLPNDWAMTNRETTDERDLIDFVLDRCEGDARRAIEDRLARDEVFAAHHRDVANTFAAVGLLAEREPPADLVERTLARVRQKRQTDALLAREEASVRPRRALFSLRELGAVAAVAGLLTCVLLPVVRRASQVASAGQCRAHQGQIGSALTAYANANDDRLPAAGRRRRWLEASGEGGTSAGLFKLVAAGYAPPAAFRCSGRSGPDEGDFEVRAGMVDFPSARSVGYSYQHTFGSNELRRSDPALAAVVESMAILADQTPAFPQGRIRTGPQRAESGNSLNHGQTGQNVLYLDMHVAWVRTPAAGVMGNNIYLVEGVAVYRGDETPAGPTDTFLLPAYTRADGPAPTP